MALTAIYSSYPFAIHGSRTASPYLFCVAAGWKGGKEKRKKKETDISIIHQPRPPGRSDWQTDKIQSSPLVNLPGGDKHSANSCRGTSLKPALIHRRREAAGLTGLELTDYLLQLSFRHTWQQDKYSHFFLFPRSDSVSLPPHALLKGS